MHAIIFLEIKRIFSFRNILVLSLFTVLSLYLVYFGTIKYEEFQEEKQAFLEYEKTKADSHINYEQYASFGFRVLLEPSPLLIFGYSSLLPIECEVNVRSIINVVLVHKGQKLFGNIGMAGDFASLFFVFGSLLMLHFGLNAFFSTPFLINHKKKHYILKSLVSRYMILIVFFAMILYCAYRLGLMLNIPLEAQDSHVYLRYAVFTLLFISLFYFVGIITSASLQFKKSMFLGAYLLWFCIIFAIPLAYNMALENKANEIQSNERINSRLIRNRVIFEKESEDYFRSLHEKKVKEIAYIARQFIEQYIKNILPLNRAVEENLNAEVGALIQFHDQNSTLLPSIFYSFLAKECSGMGYYAYQEFLDHILKLKDGFYDFYFMKRYYQTDQNVESFVNDDENTFKSGSTLPKNFSKGVGMTVVYLLLLSGGGLYVLHRRARTSVRPDRVNIDINAMEMGKTYFYHNDDRTQTAELLSYLESAGGAIIGQPDPRMPDLGVTLDAWLNFEACYQGIDKCQLEENLEILGVGRQDLRQIIKNLDSERISLAYLALMVTRDKALYVFDNFVYRKSREFESVFKDTVDQLNPHAIIIYVSNQMYEITTKEIVLPPNEGFRFVSVNLNDISLR